MPRSMCLQTRGWFLAALTASALTASVVGAGCSNDPPDTTMDGFTFVGVTRGASECGAGTNSHQVCATLTSRTARTVDISLLGRTMSGVAVGVAPTQVCACACTCGGMYGPLVVREGGVEVARYTLGDAPSMLCCETGPGLDAGLPSLDAGPGDAAVTSDASAPSDAGSADAATPDGG